MRTTCLINNYNYRNFVCEAVESALVQTYPFYEVIVVDDGSTDDSLSLLRRTYAAERRVSIVAKENGGQLSAFNAGMEMATGEAIFFLDADDRYRPDYVAQVIELYETRGIDFAIAGIEVFGSAVATPRRLFPKRDLGYSVLAALLSNAFVGGPTSSLSMRRWVADEVLPCPLENDWCTRADDVLVLGSSIVGARKYQMGVPYVDYRVHGSNHHTGRARSAARKLQHGMAVNRLVEWYASRTGYNVSELPRMLHREFATIERPTLSEWWQYTRMSWRARLPLLVRARHFGETTVYFWRERLASRESEALAPSNAAEVSTLQMQQHDAQIRRAA